MVKRIHSSQSASPVQAKNGKTPRLPAGLAFILIVAAFIVVAWSFRNPFVGQWDSFDYVTKTVRQEISDLAFGRPLFVGISIAVWDVAHRCGVGVMEAPVVGQVLVLCFAVLGLVAFYFCVKPVGGGTMALLGVAWLATTPMYLAYAGMVMTEVPSLACLMGAVALLLRWEKSERRTHLLGSAMLFAAGIHMREQLVTAAAVFPFMILLVRRMSWRRRWMAVVIHTGAAFGTVIATMLLIGHFDPDYWRRIAYWASVVRLVGHDLWPQLFYLGKFSLANSLLALIVTVLTARQWPRILPVRAIAMGLGVLPLFALLPNGDLAIQPRYEIIAVPAFILAALVGLQLTLESARPQIKKMVIASLLLAQALALVGGMMVLARFNRMSRERKDRAQELLAAAPRNAVFICGAYTPTLEFYRQTDIRPEWKVIRSGWEWPGPRLRDRIERDLKAHRPVFLLEDGQAWDYLRDEKKEVDALRTKFIFAPVDSGMEQIRQR